MKEARILVDLLGLNNVVLAMCNVCVCLKETARLVLPSYVPAQHSWTEKVTRCSSRLAFATFKGTRGLLRSDLFTKPNHTYQTKPRFDIWYLLRYLVSLRYFSENLVSTIILGCANTDTFLPIWTLFPPIRTCCPYWHILR